MLKKFLYIKCLTVLCIIAMMHVAMGAFIGEDGKTKNKFSLINLPAISKNYSFSFFNFSGFQFSNSQQVFQQNSSNGIEINSFITMQKGNTTYVYPYKYVIKAPRFKTPSPPLH